MKIENVALDCLVLDKENPRHPPIGNQKDILEYFALQKETQKLAEDIRDNGLNPAIRPLVVKLDESEYVVLDGNRRIAALKLLNDPEMAGSKERSFRNLANSWKDSIESVECIVAPSREEAWPWVVRLHSGKMDGIGQTPWDAAQKARAFPDAYPLSSAILNKIKPDFSPEYPVSTLERILDGGKDILGIVGSSSGVELPMEHYQNLLGVIIKEVEEKKSASGGTIDSRTLRKKDDIEQYILSTAKRLGTEIKPDAPKVMLPVTASTSKSTKGRTKSRPDPLLRKHLIPASFPLLARQTKVYHLLKELKGINVDAYPYAVGLLLRSLIAAASVAFLEKNGVKVKKRDSDQASIGNALDKLIQGELITDTQAKPLRTYISDRSAAISHDSLAAISHNPHTATYSADLKKFWDSISPVMEEMLKQL
ncbi:ParB/Srx family N-terminal domain-containing protein [Alcanivorax sp.]|uniref:ParB/Srx family N-terminal domain-containing protein n=1 Tax=Alcanivorax sp. TaxID=1872427 RepID=UPI002584BC08|nr:ParB/Srx family N-terminal domain-containing protein [Alcanivorax sp.]